MANSNGTLKNKRSIAAVVKEHKGKEVAFELSPKGTTLMLCANGVCIAWASDGLRSLYDKDAEEFNKIPAENFEVATACWLDEDTNEEQESDVVYLKAQNKVVRKF